MHMRNGRRMYRSVSCISDNEQYYLHMALGLQ